MKTIFITGASSGIGRATALYFAARGWNVAATMRQPQNDTALGKNKSIKLYTLDVNDAESIDKALHAAIHDFGRIDVLFNNAGYAVTGAFEAATPAQVQAQFDTNVFGVMRVTQAVLPYFRRQGAGTIVTTTSIGGLITFPLYSLYHSTKWAVEGFMESLHYELKPLGIKVKCVEPGPIKTDFYDRSMDVVQQPGLTAYDTYTDACFANMNRVAAGGPGPEVVARKVFKAATAHTHKLRYPVGGQAKAVLFMRRILPNSWFFALVRAIVQKGYKSPPKVSA